MEEARGLVDEVGKKTPLPVPSCLVRGGEVEARGWEKRQGKENVGGWQEPRASRRGPKPLRGIGWAMGRSSQGSIAWSEKLGGRS